MNSNIRSKGTYMYAPNFYVVLKNQLFIRRKTYATQIFRLPQIHLKIFYQLLDQCEEPLGNRIPHQDWVKGMQREVLEWLGGSHSFKPHQSAFLRKSYGICCYTFLYRLIFEAYGQSNQVDNTADYRSFRCFGSDQFFYIYLLVSIPTRSVKPV